MTHKEMIEALEFVLDSYREDCGRIMDEKLRQVIAALEAEPLAVAAGCIKVYAASDQTMLEQVWFGNRLGFSAGRHPVRVAIYGVDDA